ncbi:MAG TPA: R3H domain-containing nucleic acid-binding protein [Thermoanaerobaculia bacterium]|nr:R3H domain-containing nucleic acid-binding protein [Thermoanaerobaculia bacterium]
MRFEGKTEEEAVSTALKTLKRPAAELSYTVIRDEKSFWGGRVVEIEVGGVEEAAVAAGAAAAEERLPVSESAAPPEPPAAGRGERPAAVEVLDEEAWAAAEATLTELLSAAGLLVEIRRHPSPTEMVFELIGDDVEPLLANRGEGLNGLEVLTGRIAAKKLDRPVHPRVDAEGFRAHQKESLEELALRSAEEVRRTRRPQLLPPLPPAERRLVHLALAQDPDVETESEGEGFLKRVTVRLKAS